jgi:hypothetical protein
MQLPVNYTGLMLPAYILTRLSRGDSERQIAAMFPEDGELVSLWVAFLRSSHWMEKPDGKWIITEKGRKWIEKYGL